MPRIHRRSFPAALFIHCHHDSTTPLTELTPCDLLPQFTSSTVSAIPKELASVTPISPFIDCPSSTPIHRLSNCRERTTHLDLIRLTPSSHGFAMAPPPFCPCAKRQGWLPIQGRDRLYRWRRGRCHLLAIISTGIDGVMTKQLYRGRDSWTNKPAWKDVKPFKGWGPEDHRGDVKSKKSRAKAYRIAPGEMWKTHTAEFRAQEGCLQSYHRCPRSLQRVARTWAAHDRPGEPLHSAVAPKQNGSVGGHRDPQEDEETRMDMRYPAPADIHMAKLIRRQQGRHPKVCPRIKENEGKGTCPGGRARQQERFTEADQISVIITQQTTKADICLSGEKGIRARRRWGRRHGWRKRRRGRK